MLIPYLGEKSRLSNFIIPNIPTNININFLVFILYSYIIINQGKENQQKIHPINL